MPFTVGRVDLGRAIRVSRAGTSETKVTSRLRRRRPDMRANTAASSRSARLAEACVVAVLASSVIVGLAYFAKGLSDLDEGATANAELSFSDREFGGGNGVVLDQQAAYAAEGLIPVHATYRLLTGSGLKEPTSLTLPFVESWFRYFLMPRRPAVDATWLICYGCDVSQFGGKYTPSWHDDRGISIGRLG
jgi:hypothetical protein